MKVPNLNLTSPNLSLHISMKRTSILGTSPTKEVTSEDTLIQTLIDDPQKMISTLNTLRHANPQRYRSSIEIIRIEAPEFIEAYLKFPSNR